MAIDDSARLEGLAPLLAAVPVAAAIGADGEISQFNEVAFEMLDLSADDPTESFRRGLFDDGSRSRFDRLIDEGAMRPSSVRLRWGTKPPTTSLRVVGRRFEDSTMLILFLDDSEAELLDGVLTAFDNAVLVTDADRKVRWMSRGMTESYGTPFPIGSDAAEHIHPDDQDAADEIYRMALVHPRRKIRGSARVSLIDYPDIWWWIDITAMGLLEDPAVGGIAVTFGPHAEDRSDGDQFDKDGAMRLSDIMPVGVVQVAPDGRVYYRNRLAVEQFGEIAIGADGDEWIERAESDGREMLRQGMKDAIAGNWSEPVIASFPGLGTSAWFRVEFSPHLSSGGQSAGWVATSLNVTSEIEAKRELEEAHLHLRHLAHHDALTGLVNRPALLVHIEDALARARREAHEVAILYCDLDGFKPVNDRHGHDAGDVVLRTVAARMQRCVRETDIVARLGGDEFIILCESFSSPDDVVAVAERVRSLVAEPIAVGVGAGTEVVTGIAIGMAVAAANESAESLLSRADAAMYQNKPSAGGSHDSAV